MKDVEKNFVYDEHIEIEVDGVLVLGRIKKLTKYYIEIEIVYPFVNWINHSSISGIGRMDPDNFYKRYKEVSKRLLKDSYRKLSIIDSGIDRICNVYEEYQEELDTLNSIENNEIETRIKHKLNSWFYDDFIFFTRATEVVCSIYEREKIRKILQTYRREKLKIYQIKSNPFENNNIIK